MLCSIRSSESFADENTDVASYGALGHVLPRLNNNLFQCTLTFTKSDSNYMLTVASYKHQVTFVRLLAPNPGDATDHKNDSFISYSTAVEVRRVWNYHDFQ